MRESFAMELQKWHGIPWCSLANVQGQSQFWVDGDRRGHGIGGEIIQGMASGLQQEVIQGFECPVGSQARNGLCSRERRNGLDHCFALGTFLSCLFENGCLHCIRLECALEEEGFKILPRFLVILCN